MFFTHLNQRKSTEANRAVLPEELSPIHLEGDDSPASERVPVLPPQLSSYLLRFGLAVAAMLLLQTVGVIALVFLATKPAPDLVQQDNGVMARVRPLDSHIDAVPDQVVDFLEDRLPRLYTWSGLLVNSDDPTGLSYLRDPGITVPDSTGESVQIPTPLYNEQFIFDEPLRENMLRNLAQMIKDGDVGRRIFANDPSRPALASVYRFILRGKIQYPQEVSRDRWKVRVAADIVLFSSTETLGTRQQPIAEFVQDVYVRKASPIPRLFLHDQQRQDLVWYGRKDGFVIDAMLPVGPAQEVPGVPRN